MSPVYLPVLVFDGLLSWLSDSIMLIEFLMPLLPASVVCCTVSAEKRNGHGRGENNSDVSSRAFLAYIYLATF